MPLRLNQLRRFIPISSGGSPLQQEAGLLSVRYPSAIDVPPILTDDQTPLSGIFYNYLGLMVESVLAEIGLTDFRTSIAGRNTLLTFLGHELGTALSNWRQFTKNWGGNQKGQTYGLIKHFFSQTGTGWNVDRNATATSWDGVHPAGKVPVMFCHPTSFQRSTAEIVASVGGGIRGRVNNWTAVNTLSLTFRGHPSGPTPGASAGAKVFSMHAIIFFMVEAF